jgi:hypothetical protein
LTKYQFCGIFVFMIVYHNFPPQSSEDISFNRMTRNDLIEIEVESGERTFKSGTDELYACGVLIGAALLPNVVHDDKIAFTRELAIGMLLKEYDVEPELLASYTSGLDVGIMAEYVDSGIVEIEDL